MLTPNANAPELRINDLFVSYAAGAVSVPTAVLIDAHLEIRPDGRDWVDTLTHLGGVLLEDEAAAPVSDREGMLGAIFSDQDPDDPDIILTNVNDSGPLPRALADYVGVDFSDIPWRSRMPGLKEYRIPTDDGSEASLLWIRGGTAMPVHTHEGTEATLVLQGAFSDGEGRYERGDIAVADDTVDHRPMAEPGEDCICFAVCDAPVRLTGPIGRFLSPFIR